MARRSSGGINFGDTPSIQSNVAAKIKGLETINFGINTFGVLAGIIMLESCRQDSRLGFIIGETPRPGLAIEIGVLGMGNRIVGTCVWSGESCAGCGFEYGSGKIPPTCEIRWICEAPRLARCFNLQANVGGISAKAGAALEAEWRNPTESRQAQVAIADPGLRRGNIISPACPQRHG